MPSPGTTENDSNDTPKEAVRECPSCILARHHATELKTRENGIIALTNGRLTGVPEALSYRAPAKVAISAAVFDGNSLILEYFDAGHMGTFVKSS